MMGELFDNTEPPPKERETSVFPPTRAQPAPADVVEEARRVVGNWLANETVGYYDDLPADYETRQAIAKLSAMGVSDEVERLRSENERLRSALNAIRQGPLSSVAFRKAAMHISRQALTLSGGES
jgi:hypothetical protein